MKRKRSNPELSRLQIAITVLRRSLAEWAAGGGLALVGPPARRPLVVGIGEPIILRMGKPAPCRRPWKRTQGRRP